MSHKTAATVAHIIGIDTGKNTLSAHQSKAHENSITSDVLRGSDECPFS
jgi:hypothetical protein